MTEQKTDFGANLIEAMQEVLAWKQGKITLPVEEIDPMPPARIRAIRRAAAKSAREFEKNSKSPPARWKAGSKAAASRT